MKKGTNKLSKNDYSLIKEVDGLHWSECGGCIDLERRADSQYAKEYIKRKYTTLYKEQEYKSGGDSF